MSSLNWQTGTQNKPIEIQVICKQEIDLEGRTMPAGPPECPRYGLPPCEGFVVFSLGPYTLGTRIMRPTDAWPRARRQAVPRLLIE